MAKFSAFFVLTMPFVASLSLRANGVPSNLVSRREALVTTPLFISAVKPAAASILVDTYKAGGLGVKLSSGTAFPLVSFGLQVYDDDTAKKLTLVALEVPFTNINKGSISWPCNSGYHYSKAQ